MRRASAEKLSAAVRTGRSARRGRAPPAVVAAAIGSAVVVLGVAILIPCCRRSGDDPPPAVARQQEDSGLPSPESLQPAEAAKGGDGVSPERLRAAVEAAVAANAALLDSPALLALMKSRGDVAGDPREVQPPLPDDARLARNWELHFFRGSTLENYARQLDCFDIELGLLLPGGKLAYAAGFSQPKPKSRSGRADAERRYYLTWRESESQQADRELLARAGMPSEGLVILKFLPPALEARLAELETQYAAGRPGTILRTSFAVRTDRDGYSCATAVSAVQETGGVGFHTHGRDGRGTRTRGMKRNL